MFETLVVSRAVPRPDGRVGIAALFCHLLVLVIVLQQPAGPAAPAPPSREPIRIVFTMAAPSPMPARPTTSSPPAPSPRLSMENPRIPAVSLPGPIPAIAPLDPTRMVPTTGGALTAPAAVTATLEADADLPGAAEADLPPRPATAIDPAYPAALRAAGIEGTTVVEYAVGVDGRVDTASVRVIRTTHPDFVPPIRASLAGARFTPAQLARAPIAVRVRQRIVFQIR